MKRSEFAKLDAASLLSHYERRSAVRHRISFPVPCWLADGGPVWKAHLRDISAFGVALSLPQKLKLGSLLEIELQSVTVSPMRRVMARLVHLEPEERGWWVAPCAFLTELSPQELKLVRAEAIRPTTANQRRWVRFPCNGDTVFSVYASEISPAQPQPAKVLNISPGGVGFLLTCRFEPGTLVRFVFPAGPNEPPHTRPVRVVHAMEHSPGIWYHGGEFAHQHTEDDLHIFLGETGLRPPR